MPLIITGGLGSRFLLTRGLGASSTPVVTRVDVRAAVISILGASGDLAAIVGTRIYSGIRPQSAKTNPCIVINLIANPRGHNLAGADGTARARVQIDFYSPLLADCVAMKTIVESLLDGLHGTAGGLPILWAKQIDEHDTAEFADTGSDERIERISVDYSLRHRVVITRF